MLTRVDGDGRGGAALSMRAVTGKPIKLIGTGEKMDALDDFHPQRIANRILGMGDIVALVEKAAETIDAEKAQRIADKMRKGKFDLEDLADQLAQVESIGGLGGIMGMLPGMGKIKEQMAAAKIDDKMIKRQRAIILSMTPQERRNPDILKASRKKRIAAGLRRQGRGGQQAAQAAPHHGRHDEVAWAAPSAGRWRKWRRMFGLGGGMPQPTPEADRRIAEEIRRRRRDGRGHSAKPAAGAFRPSRNPACRDFPVWAAASRRLAGRLTRSWRPWPSFNPFGKKK